MLATFTPHDTHRRDLEPSVDSAPRPSTTTITADDLPTIIRGELVSVATDSSASLTLTRRVSFSVTVSEGDTYSSEDYDRGAGFVRPTLQEITEIRRELHHVCVSSFAFSFVYRSV